MEVRTDFGFEVLDWAVVVSIRGAPDDQEREAIGYGQHLLFLGGRRAGGDAVGAVDNEVLAIFLNKRVNATGKVGFGADPFGHVRTW